MQGQRYLFWLICLDFKSFQAGNETQISGGGLWDNITDYYHHHSLPLWEEARG